MGTPFVPLSKKIGIITAIGDWSLYVHGQRAPRAKSDACTCMQLFNVAGLPGQLWFPTMQKLENIFFWFFDVLKPDYAVMHVCTLMQISEWIHGYGIKADQNAGVSSTKKLKCLCSFSSSWIPEEFEVEYMYDVDEHNVFG